MTPANGYNNLVLELLEDPPITIFERDYQEWLDWTAFSILKKIRKIKRHWDYYVLHANHHEVSDFVGDIVRDVVDDFRHKFPTYNRLIVIVDGSFGIGKRLCTIENFSRYIVGNTRSKLKRTVVRMLYKYARKETNIELSRELPAKLNLEYTLEQPIPVIFEYTLIDWTKTFPEHITEKVFQDERTMETPKQIIKDLISDEVEKILEQLVKLGSRYVNVVFEEHPYLGEKTYCQIITVEGFVDKLYKTAYNNTLEFLRNGRTIF
jgi:hypothetical protein